MILPPMVPIYLEDLLQTAPPLDPLLSVSPSSTPASSLEPLESSPPVKIDMISETKAMMRTLIEAGGTMVQADLRCITEMAKSSLSGILLSLKNQKLINKRECCLTNVIELSEWFLSKKERF